MTGVSHGRVAAAGNAPLSATTPSDSLAIVLGGGGARGAYQAGVLNGIARRFPEMRVPIMTGISAGAVNTIYLASREGSFGQAARELVDLWMQVTPERIYDVRPSSLVWNAARWAARLVGGGVSIGPEPMRGMVDTQPLREFLRGRLELAADGSLPAIARNIARGSLRAVAVSATSYSTGRSITWVEGRDVTRWERPKRYSEATRLTLEHVMASSALPMLFPAVQVGDEWYGDGGIRLTAPLSPALHLGAAKILTISTRHRPANPQPPAAIARQYPPPAQVLGVLYNSVFMDMIDEDILRLQMLNRLLAARPADERNGMRLVDILVIRPSHDLRRLTAALEPRLPTLLRYMTRGLGTRQAASPDFLSLLLFQRDYLQRLVELGEADADARAEDIEAFLSRSPEGVAA